MKRVTVQVVKVGRVLLVMVWAGNRKVPPNAHQSRASLASLFGYKEQPRDLDVGEYPPPHSSDTRTETLGAM